MSKPILGSIAEGNRFVGDTRWHPDRRSRSASVKFTIYPDALAAHSGALRVIPGSHREPLFDDMTPDPRVKFGVAPADVPAYVFESQPGDVLVFEMSLWHAAFGGDVHRRQLAVTYHEGPQTPDVAAVIQDQMRRILLVTSRLLVVPLSSVPS